MATQTTENMARFAVPILAVVLFVKARDGLDEAVREASAANSRSWVSACAAFMMGLCCILCGAIVVPVFLFYFVEAVGTVLALLVHCCRRVVYKYFRNPPPDASFAKTTLANSTAASELNK